MTYTFTPLDKRVLKDPVYVPGSIPIYHRGHVDTKEPFIVSVEMKVKGPDGFYTTIPKGFTYDMASVPWVFSRVLPKAHPSICRGATLHDWLYDRQIGTKEDADLHFYNIILQDGLTPLLASSAYKAVKYFGRGAWED